MSITTVDTPRNKKPPIITTEGLLTAGIQVKYFLLQLQEDQHLVC